MKVKITRDDMMKISLFEKMTGADVMDCISDDERIVFIVKEGDVGAAIGKGGENVKTAMEKFGKKIDIIEYSTDLKKFVRNVFAPLKLEDVWIKKFGDDVVVYIRVHPKLRRTIIGNRGKNIDRAVGIVSRLSDIKNIKVVSEPRKKPKGKYPKKFEKTEKPESAQAENSSAEAKEPETEKVVSESNE
ncbi:NusA-like transcription termination signal-binding factor [Methanothermococcus sp. Ax23]|uniref:NusA-like transcription termination signal-binding factor n=1 Tax=Methanothermococcus sp. Ax23 TaxID=3156486 RepID=UPI003BA248D0